MLVWRKRRKGRKGGRRRDGEWEKKGKRRESREKEERRDR